MEELAKLKQLRQIKGLTQREAGEGIGIDQKKISPPQTNKNRRASDDAGRNQNK